MMAVLACGCEKAPGRGHRDDCPTLAALTHPDGRPKIAPVQGYTPGIPWGLHLEAYDAYRKLYGRQTSLIDLDRKNCRGGFGTEELDSFVPGWRDRVGEIAALRERVATLGAQLASAARAAKIEAFEEAAKAAYSGPIYMGGNARDENDNLPPGSPYDRGRFAAAKSVRALSSALQTEPQPNEDRHG